MAALLQLIGGTAGTAVVSLLDDTALAVRSWAPQIAEASGIRMPQPVTESLTVRAYGATHDALATNVQNLVAMQKQAGDYTQDRAGTVPVWLRVQMNSETSARQALVRRIEITHADDLYSPPAKVGNMLNLSLAIEREPYWEGTATATGGTASPAAAAAVVYDYTASGGADIVGDVSARIAYLKVTGGSAAFGRIWIGLRSANKHGTLANFVPVWECESVGADELGTDAAKATDTTASPGGGGNTKVTVTPGTSTWARRLRLGLHQVTGGDPTKNEDQFGTYLVLLRAKVSSGTWEVRFDYGRMSVLAADLIQGPIVAVAGTSWDYYEMGIMTMPPEDHYFPPTITHGNQDSYNAIHVYARRTGGTGTLDLDCICPIPIDEGFLKASNIMFTGDANPWQMEFYRSPRDVIVYSNNANDLTTYRPATYSESNFGLPPGDGRMIMVCARNGSADITDTIVLTAPQYIPRWSSLRGSA